MLFRSHALNMLSKGRPIAEIAKDKSTEGAPVKSRKRPAAVSDRWDDAKPAKKRAKTDDFAEPARKRDKADDFAEKPTKTRAKIDRADTPIKESSFKSAPAKSRKRSSAEFDKTPAREWEVPTVDDNWWENAMPPKKKSKTDLGAGAGKAGDTAKKGRPDGKTKKSGTTTGKGKGRSDNAWSDKPAKVSRRERKEKKGRR